MMPVLALALTQAAPEWPEAGGLSLLRAIVALAAVAVALGAFVWVLRRGTFALGGRRRTSGAPSVETAIPLGDRRSLVIVSVEGRRLLLGLSPVQVALLTELEAAPTNFGESLERTVRSAAGGTS
jgi:flagellar biogenesis protein FliO